MASTFTTNLNLEKPTPGEKENIWGAILNTGMDTVDSEFGKSNAGSPDGSIEGVYVGQTLYDTTNEIIWVCKTAANPGTWRAMSLAQGTKAPFYQSAAPIGWTIDTTAALANAAMRIVTASGGVTGGTDTFSASFNGSKTFTAGAQSGGATVTGSDPGATVTGSHVLTIAEMPAHTHTLPLKNTLSGSPSGGSTESGSGLSTGSTGGGTGHTHTISGAHTHTIATHTHDIITAFDVKFADLMICTRD